LRRQSWFRCCGCHFDDQGAPLNVPDTRRPVFVRLPNWVGDACMALPALQALADRGVVLRLAGSGWAAGLFAGHGWPVLRLRRQLRADASAVRALGAQHGLLFTNSLSSALVARLGGVSALGHANEGRSPLLGKAVPRSAGGHEVETFWRLAREFAAWRGLPPLSASPPARLGLMTTPGDDALARQVLVQAGIPPDSAYMVLAPLATGTPGGRSKAWGGFGELAQVLSRRGITLACCPGPGEESAAQEAVPVATQLPGLALGAYAAVLRGAALVVANDSGPMHLAAAVDAPVLGVFGNGDPARTGPWGPHGRWVGSADRWPSVDEVLQALHQTSAGLRPASAGHPAA
jgi:heptosyltransferase II